MWPLNRHYGLANASRQGPSCEAVEMSYKHSSVNAFSILPYPLGVYPCACGQLVNS